jgi:hypothetical protein
MSRYKYITVSARYDIWYYAPIGLADNWDDLTEQQRIDYLKETAVAAMKPLFSLNDETGFWEACKPEDFFEWKIESDSRKEYVSLEFVSQQPKLLLTLEGYYEHKQEIDFDDEEKFDPRIAVKRISPV